MEEKVVWDENPDCVSTKYRVIGFGKVIIKTSLGFAEFSVNYYYEEQSFPDDNFSSVVPGSLEIDSFDFERLFNEKGEEIEGDIEPTDEIQYGIEYLMNKNWETKTA